MGSLTPLTFTWHCSGPLAFLLPVCTFFTMEGGDSEYEKFTVPTLKAFLKSQSVCQARNCCLCYRMPKYTLFPCNHDFLISWKKMQRHFPHPPSPFLCNFCIRNRSGIRFNFQCYTQCEQKPLRNRPRSGSCNLSRLLAQKITKGIHSLMHTSFIELPNTFY